MSRHLGEELLVCGHGRDSIVSEIEAELTDIRGQMSPQSAVLHPGSSGSKRLPS